MNSLSGSQVTQVTVTGFEGQIRIFKYTLEIGLQWHLKATCRATMNLSPLVFARSFHCVASFTTDNGDRVLVAFVNQDSAFAALWDVSRLVTMKTFER